MIDYTQGLSEILGNSYQKQIVIEKDHLTVLKKDVTQSQVIYKFLTNVRCIRKNVIQIQAKSN
jgi:hypothetical protein